MLVYGIFRPQKFAFKAKFLGAPFTRSKISKRDFKSRFTRVSAYFGDLPCRQISEKTTRITAF